MNHELTVPYLLESIIFLGAAIVAVSVFKRLGMSSILGFLAAGIAIGPFGAGLINESEDVLHVAELGIVLLLFVIGLGLQPSRLWSMRQDVFALGSAQIIITGCIFAFIAYVFEVSISQSFIIGFGLALSSTAFALQILQDRGQLFTHYGQRAFGILLMQDISIVPLLALVSIMATTTGGNTEMALWLELLIDLCGIALLVLIGYFLLDPILSLIARFNARELMLPCALLIVLGSAVLMDVLGLSMALGAFLIGVLLAESSYRHVLEADIEPFRTLFMGLFFMAVGMTLDLPTIASNWLLVAAVVLLVMTVKGLVLWTLSRFAGSSNSDALRIALTLPQGGEFAFVLFSAAVAGGIMHSEDSSILFSIVIVTMIMTPVADLLFDYIATKLTDRGMEPDLIDSFSDANANVLIIGFGRFGMLVGQMLASEGINITAIDNRPARIRYARRLGFKVLYGDATRIDVLKAAGAEQAVMFALCLEQKVSMIKSVNLIRNHFPSAAIFCRATNQAHAIDLENLEVDFQIRETFESGIVFGKSALEHLGIPSSRVQTIEEDVRQRDRERFNLQKREGKYAGSDFLHQQTPRAEEDKMVE